MRDAVKAALGRNFTSGQRLKVQQGRGGQWMDVATFTAGSYRGFAQAALRVPTASYLAALIGKMQA